jgi:hypothetical protein
VVQVFQLYRLMLPLLRLMVSTIVDQFQQLYIALIFAAIILVLISQSIFLQEMERDGEHGIFDAFWFGYITLTTIGYVFDGNGRAGVVDCKLRQLLPSVTAT